MIELKSFHYDLKETLYSGQAFRWREVENSSYPSPLVHQSVIGNYRVNVWDVLDNVCASSPSLDDVELKKLVSDYLRLDDDLNDIYSTFESDTFVSAAVDKYKGLHILRQDPWECLITFICSANNNIPRIRQLVDKLCHSYGELHWDIEGSYHSFPTPERIVECGELNLRRLGLGFRAKYVFASAVRILEQGIDLLALRTQDYERGLEILTAFPGVGDKVANCVLLFSMDKLDAFPVDVWIKRVLRESYLTKADENVPDSKLRAWAQNKFGAYAGYANQYMFHKRRLD